MDKEASEKTIETKLPETKKSVIAFDKGFVPKTLEDVARIAGLYLKASVAPRKAGFDTAEKIGAAMEYCSKMGLVFQSAVNNMAWINDRLVLWGDLPAAICRNSGEMERLTTTLVDSDYNEISMKNKNLDKEVFAAVTTIKRKGHEEREYFFTRTEAKNAGLLSKDVWKSWAPIMIKRKSIGLALKFEMSDVLMGVGIAEHDFNMAPDLRDVTSTNTSTTGFISNTFDPVTSPCDSQGVVGGGDVPVDSPISTENE